MSNYEHLYMDDYRAEIEWWDDDELFSETDLAELTVSRMKSLVEQYEEQLDNMGMEELYGHEEWEGIRAAKIEELVAARAEAIRADDHMAAFRRAYQVLARCGKCDSWGGAESKRVLSEWLEAGKPFDVEAFITKRANKMPE